MPVRLNITIDEDLLRGHVVVTRDETVLRSA